MFETDPVFEHQNLSFSLKIINQINKINKFVENKDDIDNIGTTIRPDKPGLKEEPNLEQVE